MTSTADLHIHTNFSDGSDSPEEVVRLAIDKELSCIAITDHDMIAGVEPAIKAAEGSGLEVISGVELSTEIAGKDVHILGYCFDIHSSALQERLQIFCDTRIGRAKEIVKKLQVIGLDIEEEDVLSLADSDAVGRPHVAQALLNKGHVKTIGEAFDKYIAEGKPGFLPKHKQTPFEAIKLIHDAGGVAVMAHPMQTQRDELIPQLVEAGLQGLEVYYPNSSKKIIEYYERIADKHGLIKTGGSDAHGRFKDYSPIGMVRVNISAVEKLKKAAASI